MLLKKRYLEGLGFPVETLLITVVLDESGEGHAVLSVRTDRGDFVLDNRRSAILLWSETRYEFLKRQSQENPQLWVALTRKTRRGELNIARRPVGTRGNQSLDSYETARSASPPHPPPDRVLRSRHCSHPMPAPSFATAILPRKKFGRRGDRRPNRIPLPGPDARSASHYLIGPETEPKTMPRPVLMAGMAAVSARPVAAAISAYSIAVAPNLSFKRRTKLTMDFSQSRREEPRGEPLKISSPIRSSAFQ